MDLYINRDELSRGLARVQGIVERRSTHPLLSHVLLHARDHGEEGGLRVTATDTEVAFIGDLAANVERKGELAVEAAHLFQIVRALPEDTVQLTIGTGNRLEIRSGRAFFRLPGFSADEYPPLPAFDATGSAKMEERALRRLVEQTAFAVATDDVRYGLNGAYLEETETDGGPRLMMVATDGHRLSASKAAFEGKLSITPRMLVPRKALTVIKRLLGDSEQQIEVSFGVGAIRLSREGQVFWFRLLDGEFPDYGAVIPSENKHRAVIRRDSLASTLKRVMILVADRTRAVRFAFTEDELKIEVHNVDRGEVREGLPIELEGGDISVGFNARYLSDILAVLKSETVLLELAHPLAPCLVRDADDPEAFFVVMPMRLD
jgi:DNA polymerase-3 subunit beta